MNLDTLRDQLEFDFGPGYESEAPKIPIGSVMAVLSLVQKALYQGVERAALETIQHARHGAGVGDTARASDILRDYWAFLDYFYNKNNDLP